MTRLVDEYSYSIAYSRMNVEQGKFGPLFMGIVRASPRFYWLLNWLQCTGTIHAAGPRYLGDIANRANSNSMTVHMKQKEPPQMCLFFVRFPS